MRRAGHVCSPGTGSSHIPAAWHGTGTGGQPPVTPVTPAPSPFAYLHQGCLALPGSMQRKRGIEGIPSPAPPQESGCSSLHSKSRIGFIEEKTLIMYLAAPETAGCSTSSAYPQLSLKLQISQPPFLSNDQRVAGEMGLLGAFHKEGMALRGCCALMPASPEEPCSSYHITLWNRDKPCMGFECTCQQSSSSGRTCTPLSEVTSSNWIFLHHINTRFLGWELCLLKKL